MFDRVTLNLIKLEEFDLLSEPSTETLIGHRDEYYTNEYRFNEDGGLEAGTPFREVDKVYNRTNVYEASNRMAKVLRQYDSTVFVVIVSNYAWEA